MFMDLPVLLGPLYRDGVGKVRPKKETSAAELDLIRSFNRDHLSDEQDTDVAKHRDFKVRLQLLYLRLFFSFPFFLALQS